MKFLSVVILAMALVGCSVTPYEELNLDTTSDFTAPNEGKAGVYVYQRKTGLIGSSLDVDFEIKGLPEISLNTGEYGHFDVDPGDYEYKFSGGMVKQYIPVTFQAGHNYFFRAALLNFSDHAYLVRDQQEIDAVKKHIREGSYELFSVD